MLIGDTPQDANSGVRVVAVASGRSSTGDLADAVLADLTDTAEIVRLVKA